MKGLLPLLALGLLAGAANAQQPSSTFRADVNLVEVHAVVTDSRGNFVSGLTKADFEIFEDGRPQIPTIFDLVDVPLAPPAVVTSVESDVRTTTASFNGRLYVFVLDDLHTTTFRSPQVRAAARKFIDQYLGPDDLAAVVYTSGRQEASQELTNSRRLLRASIDKFQGQKLPSASAERLGVHFRERGLENPSSDSGSGESGASKQPSNHRSDDPLDGERGFNARRSLDLVRDVARWMSGVTGRRKALVLLGEGIDYDIYDVFNNRSASSIIFDAREAIAAAQRANVAIYAVDPRGLTDMGDTSIEIASLSPDASVPYGTTRDFQRELLLAQESLTWLAEDTGGFAVVRNNDIAGGLRRIAEDNSRYYILGYTADPSRSPGKFRSLQVRVRQPGLTVRARRGYVPADLGAAGRKPETETKAGTSPALVAALNNPLPLGDIPVRLFAAPFKGTGRNGSVLITVEVDGRSLKFDQRDGRFLNNLEFSIIAADHQGKVRDTDRQEMKLTLKPETHQRVVNGGVRILSRLDVPPARYQLRVGVHESVSGRVSTVPYDIEVPDYSKADFTLSGLTITSSNAATYMTPLPDARVKEAFPVPPVATRAFRRDETVGLQVELYDNSVPNAHTVEVKTTIRREADQTPVFNAVESRTIAAGVRARTHGFKAEIPLRDLAPGAYVLRVEAVSQHDGKSTVREVPIAVLASVNNIIP